MITYSMIKQKLSKSPKLITLMVGLVLAGSLVGPVAADQYDQQINQLQAENNALAVQNQTLAQEAVGFQATIDNLAAQINGLEFQIRDNQTKQQQLQTEISALEAEMAYHQGILGQNIKAMYLEGQISTFEVLAASNDLSSFVDKEQYRNTVKDKVSETLDTINRLKSDVEAKKVQVEKTIADQRAIQLTLDAQKAEQARLLSLNQTERNSLDAEMRSNASEINNLRKEQAATNARLFGNGVRNVADNSGYPWAGVAFPNSSSDPWGMYKRQCVSYTAWKVANSGRSMPYWGGRGNAKQWDDNARAAGIPVDNNPRVGDVAVSNSGTYGHVMYVEAVFGDGTIYVSQYNASWTGTYSEARIPTGSLVFIHF